MRGTVAKRLRNEARKISEPTEYNTKWIEKLVRIFKSDGSPDSEKQKRGTIYCTGYKRTYRDMKKKYKNRK